MPLLTRVSCPEENAAQRFYEDMWAGSWRTLHRIGPVTRTRYRLILGLLRHRIKSGQRVLDAGCGSGGLLLQLSHAFPGVRLFGAEYAKEALAQVPPGLCEQTFQGSLEDSTLLGKQYFNVIICSEVFEHLQRDDSAVAALADALEPDGLLIVTVPHRRKYWGPQDECAGHRRRYELDELTALVERVGLQPERGFAWGFPFTAAYLRLVQNQSPAQLARYSNGRLARLVSTALYHLFRLDDYVHSLRGPQLVLLARKQDRTVRPLPAAG